MKTFYVCYQVRNHGAIGAFSQKCDVISAEDGESVLESFRMRHCAQCDFGAPVSVVQVDGDRLLRNVLLGYTGYRLLTWDTYKTDSMGKHVLGYAFYQPACDPPCDKDSIPLFCGEDFHCSPFDCIDSDNACRSLLGFLTLKPGDTDPEYFDGYTEEQRAFAESEAEALQEWSMDPNDSDDPEDFARCVRFVEVDQ